MIWYLHCSITWYRNDNSGHIENTYYKENIYFKLYLKYIFFIDKYIYFFIRKLNIFPIEGTNLVHNLVHL